MWTLLRNCGLRRAIFSVLIACLIEFPFALLAMQGPHLQQGAIGMSFFLPAWILILTLTGNSFTPIAAILICQTILISIPVFWTLSWRNRSIAATAIRLSSFALLVGAITILLFRFEQRRASRQDAIERAAGNAAVGSLETLNKALAIYRNKYGEYPEKLDQLAGPSEGRVDARHAGLVRLPLPMEEFFAFSYAARADNGRYTSYEIYADARTGKWSDLYHYYTDQSGLIRFDTTHETAKHGPVVYQQLRPSVTIE